MSNARRRGLGVAALAVLPAVLMIVAGCSGDDSATEPTTLALRVETQNWTGWQKQQPEPEVTSASVTDGSAFDVSASGGPISFTVVEIADDRVELETDGSLIVDEDGGIDFDDATTRFTLERDEPLKLTTPTMDGGTHITLSFE